MNAIENADAWVSTKSLRCFAGAFEVPETALVFDWALALDFARDALATSPEISADECERVLAALARASAAAK